MQGSIRKKGATWSYRVEFGAAGGKRNQIERSGYKTKKEAAKALNDVLYLYNNTGDYVENKKITFHRGLHGICRKRSPGNKSLCNHRAL